MKIESKIQRKKGTQVTFDDVTYHFKPEVPGGPHYAEVEDADHAERFLAISEGFRAAEGKAKSAPAPVKEPEPPASLPGTHVLQGSNGEGQAGGNADAEPPVPPTPEAPKDGAPKADKPAKAAKPAKVVVPKKGRGE